MCGIAGSNRAAAKSIRSLRRKCKPARTIAAPVSLAGWQPPAIAGQRPLRSAACEQQALGLAERDYVLVEPKLPAGPQHPPQLGQRPVLAGDRAQHQAGHGGVDAGVRQRDAVGDSGDHADRHGGVRGRTRGRGAQRRLGLERDHLGDAAG